MPTGFRLLGNFIEHAGEVVMRQELLETAWGYNAMPFTRTVDSHIAKLCTKIETDPSSPKHQITVHRMG
jgi:DNA-binding response OmpR family regulator